ncbi:MAG: HAMP domain-containing histidine kinase [Gammaproteobacteria bacterium]|nr:HAMP domain-containing histidine kinase [Gammaproteobacteria bacterium]
MIEITTINIYSVADIIELRNKLLTLLTELGFNEMQSVKISAIISDIMHHFYIFQKTLNTKLFLQNEARPHQFVMTTNTAEIPTEIIDHYHLIPDKEKNIYLHFPLHNKEITLTENTLQTLREQMIIKSKSELIREIKQKNIALNNLLEELKKSSTLIQSEKMRALGVLTAGVAHELNNPMMGILNFIQYCLKKTDNEDKRFNALKDAETETKRCIEIVSNLLTFSHLEKEDDQDFKPVDLVTLIKRVIKILSYRLRNEKITVQENIPEHVPQVMGHENRLQQVILNLITNALDAMKETEEKCLILNLEIKNDRVKVIIADTGEGMDDKTIKKIFEPFFTTKPTGSGTGLGLSVCESIIKEHKGHILCHSIKNQGTQFLLNLPIEISSSETTH